MRSHKFLTAVGATATAGAAAYVFKDAISTALKPLSDRLVQYTLEQVMISVKNESKAEARQERFKETGEVARQAAFVFLPQIGRELRTRLDKKGILKKLRDCNKEAAAAASGKTSDSDAAISKKRKADLWSELLAVQVAQYAAAIYTSALLIASFRLHLTILARRTLDRPPRRPKEGVKATDEDEGRLSKINSTDNSHPSGLEDLGSQETREIVHTHAYRVVESSMTAIVSACRHSASNVLDDAQWSGTTLVTGEEITSMIDKVLGGAHELLFSAALHSEGFSHDFASCTFDLKDKDCAVGLVIRECNSMLKSTAFIDVIASVAVGVSDAYGKALQDDLAEQLPRDGDCKVDKAQVGKVISSLAQVEIEILDEAPPTKEQLSVGAADSEDALESERYVTKDLESSKSKSEAGNSKEESKSQRERLADLLSANGGELIAQLAGIGPKLQNTNTTKIFLDDCVHAIREGGSGNRQQSVDAEELVCVLEHILEDVLTRLPLVRALSHGTKVTQTKMLKRPTKVTQQDESESKNDMAHPLDKVLTKEPNLGSFLVTCYEDIVDTHDSMGVAE